MAKSGIRAAPAKNGTAVGASDKVLRPAKAKVAGKVNAPPKDSPMLSDLSWRIRWMASQMQTAPAHSRLPAINQLGIKGSKLDRAAVHPSTSRMPNGTYRLVVFWSGAPHHLTDIRPLNSPDKSVSCAVYLPLDALFFMTHIPPFHMALLSSGMMERRETLCSEWQVRRWCSDYRTGDF